MHSCFVVASSSVSSFQQSQYSSVSGQTINIKGVPARKHPVSLLQEHCQKFRKVPVFETDDEKGPCGFECRVTIEGELIATAVCGNKKDAKKKCAENALQVFFPDTAVSTSG